MGAKIVIKHNHAFSAIRDSIPLAFLRGLTASGFLDVEGRRDTGTRRVHFCRTHHPALMGMTTGISRI